MPNGRIGLFSRTFFFVTGCVVLVAASAAQAVPIRDLPGIGGVVVFERSGSQLSQLFWLPDSSVLTTRRSDRLSLQNTDFPSNANEFYDVFYSDADGTLNPNGAFLSITAVFDGAPDSGLNISGVQLNSVINFQSVTEYASVVSSFVALGVDPASVNVDNALGSNLNTTTFLGHTAGQPDSARLSLTLGFESTAQTGPTSVPEPGSLPLFAGGLGLLGLVTWRRHRTP